MPKCPASTFPGRSDFIPRFLPFAMPHWLLKSAVHRAVSCLPARRFWSDLLRGRSVELGEEAFFVTLGFFRKHRASARENGTPLAEGYTVFELGTGWNPVQPLAHFLCGAGRVHSFDIEPLLQPRRVARVLDYFLEAGRAGRLETELPGLLPGRLARLEAARAGAEERPAAETLARLDIDIQVRDARQSGLPAASMDFLFSHSVLEYVPRAPFGELLREFRRVAKPGAVTSHYIRLSDQFHHFDRSLSPFHFLRYPAALWRWLDSPIIPQSRLRICDCREIFAESGWRIFREDNTLGSLEDLRRVPLAPEFRHYREEDLRVVASWLAAL